MLSASVKREYFNFTRQGIEDCLVSAGFKITAITARDGHFCVLGPLLHCSVKAYLASVLPKGLKPALPLFWGIAFGFKRKACFRAIDRLDTNQHSSLGWTVCAEKSDH